MAKAIERTWRDDPTLAVATAVCALAAHVWCRLQAAAGTWICSSTPRAPMNGWCLLTGTLAVIAILWALKTSLVRLKAVKAHG